MSDKPWKAFERDVARFFGGRRYPANTGGPIDYENERLVVQCKNVARMSLGELTRLAEACDEQGRARGKLGVVAIKLRAGQGRPTPTVYAMTGRSLAALLGKEREC